MKHKLKIDIENKEAVLAILQAAGVKWKCGRAIENDDAKTTYPTFFLNEDGLLMHQIRSETPAEQTVKTLDELSAYVFSKKAKQKTVEIELEHGDYATVNFTKKSVKVGCKDVPFSAVPKFLKAIEPQEDIILGGDLVEINFDDRVVECDTFLVTFDEVRKIAALVERGA